MSEQKPKSQNSSTCAAPVCNYKEPKKDRVNVTFIISTALVMIGWVVGSWLNENANAKARRMDEKIKYLISAYDDIVTGTILHYHKRKSDSMSKLQSAFTKIQLFGNAYQIELVQAAGDSLDTGGPMPIVKLVNSVRNDLRELMGSMPTQEKIRFMQADTTWIYNPSGIKPAF